MNALVSIIVPCYNQAQYLSETLDSVLTQTYPYWECIIVNDGSLDNTEEIAKQFCDKDSRFKYFFRENGGLSSARNFGIRNSIGEFILPLDSDDLIGENYLINALKYFMKFPDVKLVYCKAQLFGEITGEWKLPDYDFLNLLFENIIFCSAIYKRKDYNLTSGYNENLKKGLEDWDFWLSLLSSSDIVYKIPEFYFYYRIRKGSMLRSISDKTGYELRIDIYNNHIEKFKEFIPPLIWMNPQIIDQQSYILSLENEVKRIKLSKAFRLGKFILKPFSYLQNKIK